MRTPAFWYRAPGVLADALTPLGWLYGLAGRLRLARAKPFRTAIPVICVGNLVAGGAGKTPVALGIADLLCRAGLAVHFLTRGHGGREKGPLRADPARHDAAAVGDEALLLAAAAPTWVARDRAAGARAAEAAGAQVLVMDDGFQNPHLVKTLSLLVVDGTAGFGNGRLIPAGPLREPVARGLDRADAAIIMGDDRYGLASRLGATVPVLHARLEPLPAAGVLSGRRIYAFAGIGRPEKFFETCAALGAELAGTAAFPDHHPFQPDEIMTMVERAHRLGAVPVTTAKDAARLPALARPMVQVVPIGVVWRDPDAVNRLLVERIVRHGQ